MKRDMIYHGLNVDFVLAFFAGTKEKKDRLGNIYSDFHFRKFNDAILCGAHTLGHNLPSTYFTEYKVPKREDKLTSKQLRRFLIHYFVYFLDGH